MAVGIRIKIPGGTQEQYDAAHSGMNIAGDPPDGMIFHSAGPIDGGWGVIDVWESRAHFDSFSENRLGPQLAALGDRGFPAAPEIKEFPVHNFTRGR